MSDDKPLVIGLIPWPSVMFACAGAGILLASMLMPDLGAGERARGVVGGLALVFVGCLVIVKRAAIIHIGDQIIYRRLRMELQLPAGAAESISVTRRLSIYTPAHWDIVVVIGGDEQRLPFAAHYWVGGHLRRRAETIAERLQVPIEDPVGDEWRRSRFLPMRILGSGHEWWLIVGPVAALLVVFAALAIALG